MRVFLIGYEPAAWRHMSAGARKRLTRRLVEDCDVSGMVPDGWPLGDVRTVGDQRMRCIKSEHDGKLVTVEPVGASN